MASAESTGGSSVQTLNIEFMRSLVKQYSELGQWTSALFWADAAAGAGAAAEGGASGDDVWLLASAMLARGDLHRAAHTVTSRGLHRRHLLCLGVAMRAHVTAREPAAALALMDECDTLLLEKRPADQTHNRALAGVLVWQAQALSALERREAAADALSTALRADVACVEALDLLLNQHALTPAQESELVSSLPINAQLGPAEGALLKAAYTERLRRYEPHHISDTPVVSDDPLSRCIEEVRSKTSEGAESLARRLAAGGSFAAALKALESAGPWAAADLRVACLVEMKKASQLFALAHTLVDAYPQSWQSWYAVGCYYYLIGKSQFARRYLSKAKSLEAGAGCVWLAYGHSFTSDAEHDQAMAAYFKASQLMPGCYLPPLYVAVECSLLNNVAMCERFLMRAADLYNNQTSIEPPEEPDENKSGWERLSVHVVSAHVAHEAGCCALAAGRPTAAAPLLQRAYTAALKMQPHSQLSSEWAATLDALGHAYRRLGHAAEALSWHEKALSLRPAHAPTYAAIGLCLALLGRETEAANVLHTALSKDPDDVVALALLDAIVDRLDAALTEEEIPQFAFPTVVLSPAVGVGVGVVGGGGGDPDATDTSQMSMSFE